MFTKILDVNEFLTLLTIPLVIEIACHCEERSDVATSHGDAEGRRSPRRLSLLVMAGVVFRKNELLMV